MELYMGNPLAAADDAGELRISVGWALPTIIS
jgi:hypothetical protein